MMELDDGRRECFVKEELLRRRGNLKKTKGVSHGGLAIYVKKYLKAKEEL
jgi:hypothetical protein